MFKRHQYTCPDVIYLRNRQKKIQIAAIGAQIVFWGGLWLASQKQVAEPLDLPETPTED